MTLTIELPDEKIDQLKALATRHGITLEQIVVDSAIALVAETAEARRERLAKATQRILEKNAELYKRLA